MGDNPIILIFDMQNIEAQRGRERESTERISQFMNRSQDIEQ